MNELLRRYLRKQFYLVPTMIHRKLPDIFSHKELWSYYNIFQHTLKVNNFINKALLCIHNVLKVFKVF